MTTYVDQGFTRPTSLDENLTRIPNVVELVGDDTSVVTDPSRLSVVVSYRHTTVLRSAEIS